MNITAKIAEKKQEKIDREAAGEILSGLNDFMSLINDVSNETGYDIPGEHEAALRKLHEELLSKMLGRVKGK